jgi:uncharacterized protein GlcG (DUF336 family)
MTHSVALTIRASILATGFAASVLLAVGTTAAVAQTPPPTTYTKQSLTLEAANAAVAAGIAKSKELGILSTVAIYDEGGTPKALATMDGARYTGVQLAMDKAWTAARRLAPTQDLADAMAMGPDNELAQLLETAADDLVGRWHADCCRRSDRGRNWFQRRHDRTRHRGCGCGSSGYSALGRSVQAARHRGLLSSRLMPTRAPTVLLHQGAAIRDLAWGPRRWTTGPMSRAWLQHPL